MKNITLLGRRDPWLKSAIKKTRIKPNSKCLLVEKNDFIYYNSLLLALPQDSEVTKMHASRRHAHFLSLSVQTMTLIAICISGFWSFTVKLPKMTLQLTKKGWKEAVLIQGTKGNNHLHNSLALIFYFLN